MATDAGDVGKFSYLSRPKIYFIICWEDDKNVFFLFLSSSNGIFRRAVLKYRPNKRIPKKIVISAKIEGYVGTAIGFCL